MTLPALKASAPVEGEAEAVEDSFEKAMREATPIESAHQEGSG